jgi:hypothetical protein
VFTTGSTAVRRDVLNGKIWSAAAHRVIEDRDGVLVLACWPGAESLAPTTWIEWLRSGNDAVRKQAIPDLARGRWKLGRWVWRETATLSWFGLDPDFSVHRFFPLTPDQSPRWYINFERPPRRTPIGIDTLDLLLDLVVDVDLSRWTWKDEDEYAHARHLGLIADTEHRCIERARQRALAMIESCSGPFAADWSNWHVPRAWPVPALPSEALATFTARPTTPVDHPKESPADRPAQARDS